MLHWISITALAWYFGLNAAAFLLFLWDKRAARRGSWRVRERTLLTLAWLGGFAGAFLGMRLARHKTRKWLFRLTPLLALALHAAAWWFLLLPLTLPNA
jgi:uncharacterized membrane protein YsdA (DUF1294 family)